MDDKLLDVLSDMIKIPSINPPGREEEMGKYVSDLLEDYGIPCKKYPFAEGRFNILAKLEGRSSNNPLIFTGHMDVVPVSEAEKERWKTDPFLPVIREGKIFGRGAADMKGGLTAGLLAAISLKRRQITPPRDIYLAVTADEEDYMGGSKVLYNLPELDKAKEVVVMEPTSLKCCTAGWGRTYGVITLSGKTGHGSGGVSAGNAILLAHKFLSSMMKEALPEDPTYGQSFWQPVAVNAGVEPCVIPDVCVVKIDARLHPNHPTADIWERTERILESCGFSPGDVSISVIDRREGFVTDENSEIIRNVKEASEKTGLFYEEDVFPGTTDGSMFLKTGRDVVIIGPGSLDTVHRENEYLEIPEWQRAYQLYRQMMLGEK